MKILTVTLNPAIDLTLGVNGFKKGGLNIPEFSLKHAGGKGINVATALSMEFDVDAAGFIGNQNDDIFRFHFIKHTIGDKFIYINGKTRECIKISDSLNDETTEINLSGTAPSEKDIDDFIVEFKRIIPDYSYLLLCGSLPNGIPDNFYATLGKEAKKHGVYTILDSRGTPLLNGIESGFIDMVKTNIDEICEIYPDKKTDEIALTLLNKVKIVAITRGLKGSVIYSDGEKYSASAPTVDNPKTVGAGDTYLAGFIAGLYNNRSIGDSIVTAVTWAASKLHHYGSGCSSERPSGLYRDKVVVESEAFPKS